MEAIGVVMLAVTIVVVSYSTGKHWERAEIVDACENLQRFQAEGRVFDCEPREAERND